jgi:hypothetical protein
MENVLFKEFSHSIMVTRNPDQHRFYGMRQVTQKKRYYHPLSILPEVGCIAGSVLNC